MAHRPPAAGPLQLTRRSFRAAGSGDYDLMMSFYGRDSVFDMAAWGLGIHSGEARIRTFFEQWIGAFAEFDMQLEEARELSDGVVFAVALQTAREMRRRDYLQIRHAAIIAWEDGVAIRVTNYRDIDEARALAEKIAEAVT